jgi:hypothetical protein
MGQGICWLFGHYWGRWKSWSVPERLTGAPLVVQKCRRCKRRRYRRAVIW